MKSIFIRVTGLMILLASFLISIEAQGSPSTSEPSGQALEITFYNGDRPAHINLRKECPCGAWFGRFQRVKDWQQPEGLDPVRAVNIVPRIIGDKVNIRITVFTGKRFHENEEFVAEYFVSQNDKISVPELRKFGVEPFEIAVIHVTPSIGNVPVIVNGTQSVQVSLRPAYATLPSFHAKFFNYSNKPIIAIAWKTHTGDRELLSGFPHGLQGKPLMLPNESYERTIGVALPGNPASSAIPAEARPRILFVVEAVVFEDGTFEGDAKKAATYRGFMAGRKHRLSNLIQILKATIEKEPKIIEIDQLITRVAADADHIGEPVFAEFLNDFPNFTEKERRDVRRSAEIASSGVKREMLEALRQLQAAPGQSPAGLQNGLRELVRNYQDWLERLSK